MKARFWKRKDMKNNYYDRENDPSKSKSLDILD